MDFPSIGKFLIIEKDIPSRPGAVSLFLMAFSNSHMDTSDDRFRLTDVKAGVFGEAKSGAKDLSK